MTEGRQTEAGEREAHPRDNVVRLPRDWLGPRDELVPFGPSADSDIDPKAPPPSAEDFWGERSASIHDALAAPAEGASAAAPARRRIVRRPIATAAVGLTVAAALIVAFVSILPGTGEPPHPVIGSKIGVASVFGGGVTRLLQLGLAELDAKVPDAVHSRTTLASVHRSPHRAPAKRSNRRQHPQLSSTSPVSIDIAHATTTSANTDAEASNVETTPHYQSAPTPPPSRAAESAATVSPTGESGALGPVQSPNG